ncbi:hypothetical protein D3C76_1420610 [compost metagenome]
MSDAESVWQGLSGYEFHTRYVICHGKVYSIHFLVDGGSNICKPYTVSEILSCRHCDRSVQRCSGQITGNLILSADVNL